MAAKGTQEREELHNAIWRIADELRGSVDGWDFKNYILITLFYRYISEHIASYVNEEQGGTESFSYEDIDDISAEIYRKNLIYEKGFFIYPSELFANVLKNSRSYENLNITLEKIFKNIEDSSKEGERADHFAGLFPDFDVNSEKLGRTTQERNDKLYKLLSGIASMNLGSFQDHSIDVFGDAYEYLMFMYASNAGKSGGEFFTPQDVSELLVRLGIGHRDYIDRVYDPACGSGSLLLKTAKILKEEGRVGQFLGQEKNLTTYNLCRINMFLHDVDSFDIKHGDTLVHPLHDRDNGFDLIVSNPPYSLTWDGDKNATLINDPRFSPAATLAPRTKADMAFVMHCLYHLKSSQEARATIVSFPGVFYRDGAERKIRKYLVDNNFVDAVISLPNNLFFGTSVSTCILVLKRIKDTNDVMFIDASSEYVSVTNGNRLTQEGMDKIVRAYLEREELEHFSKAISNEKIIKERYDLSVGTYVDREIQEESIDIAALNSKINSIVSRTEELRRELDHIIHRLGE